MTKIRAILAILATLVLFTAVPATVATTTASAATVTCPTGFSQDYIVWVHTNGHETCYSGGDATLNLSNGYGVYMYKWHTMLVYYWDYNDCTSEGCQTFVLDANFQGANQRWAQPSYMNFVTTIDVER